jgi:hypothetical protein
MSGPSGLPAWFYGSGAPRTPPKPPPRALDRPTRNGNEVSRGGWPGGRLEGRSLENTVPNEPGIRPGVQLYSTPRRDQFLIGCPPDPSEAPSPSPGSTHKERERGLPGRVARRQTRRQKPRKHCAERTWNRPRCPIGTWNRPRCSIIVFHFSLRSNRKAEIKKHAGQRQCTKHALLGQLRRTPIPCEIAETFVWGWPRSAAESKKEARSRKEKKARIRAQICSIIPGT